MKTTFAALVAQVSTVVALGLGSAYAPAQAAIVTTGCENSGISCTLDELFAGGSFTVGEQTYDTFSFWAAYEFGGFEDLDLAFDQIVVTPFTRREGLHGFNMVAYGDYGAPAGDWYLGFDYHVSSSTPLLASGIEFGSGVSSGSEAYGQSLLDDGTWSDYVVGVPGLYWDDYAPPGPLVLPTTPPGMLSFADTYLAAGDPLDVSHLHLSTVTPVPEPLSVYMALAGLAVVTGAARRRRAARGE